LVVSTLARPSRTLSDRGEGSGASADFTVRFGLQKGFPNDQADCP